MLKTFYIQVDAPMCSMINSLIRFRACDRYQFITDVSIFAIVVAFSFPLQLPFGAIAVILN